MGIDSGEVVAPSINPGVESLLATIYRDAHLNLVPAFCRPTAEMEQLVFTALEDERLGEYGAAMIRLRFGFDGEEMRIYKDCAAALGFHTRNEQACLRNVTLKGVTIMAEYLAPAFAKGYFTDYEACSLDYLGLPKYLRDLLHRATYETIGDLTRKTPLQLWRTTPLLGPDGVATIEKALAYFDLTLASSPGEGSKTA